MRLPVLCCAWLYVFPLSGAWADTADYSDGFKRLAALGMPALGPDVEWASSNEARESDYEMAELTRPLKGNAWLLPAGDGAVRMVPLGSAAVTELQAAAKRPPARDLAKDVETLVNSLQKLAAKSDEADPFSERETVPGLGGLLLFAVQLHQTGREELANKLASMVFDLSPNHEAVVDAAIDRIAEHFYQEAAGSFFKSGDWAAYQQALESLIKRFPRGWAALDAVAMLQPQIAKRAAGARAPDPSLPGVELDPQALAIIRELAEKAPSDAAGNEGGSASAARQRMRMMGYQEGAYHQMRQLWLLDDVSGENEDAPAIARLCALKMKALPALAALAGDRELTHFPNSGYRSSYYSSDEGPEERTLRIYSGMQRPLSRGEIARQLLAPTLPDAQGELGNADAESLRDLALAFWKEHKDAPPAKLAAVFLSEGSESQISQAASILAKSSDPEAQRLFETHVLGMENAVNAYQGVQALLRARKEAGKPFFEAYAKLVRSQAANPSDSRGSSWMIEQAGGVDKLLKQLEGLLRDQSPRELAMQIAKGTEEDSETSIGTLSELLAETAPDERLAILLEGAEKSRLGFVRARFIAAILSIRSPMGEDEEKPSPAREFSRAEAAKWRAFLDDKRKIPEKLAGITGGEPIVNIAELAAVAFEYSISPMIPYQVIRAAPVIGKPPKEILRDRAMARLAGEAVPPLPDATRVTGERLAAIVAETAAKPPEDIHPYLKTLSPDERAAWLAWLAEPGEIAIPESVAKLRLKVSGVFEQRAEDFIPVEDHAGIGEGFELSVENLKTHLKTLAEDIPRHSLTYIIIASADFGPGLKAGAFKWQMPDAKNQPARHRDNSGMFRSMGYAFRNRDEAEAVIQLYFGGMSGGSGRAMWFVEKGNLTPAEPDKQSEMESALKELLDTPSGRFYLNMQVLSKADAVKIMERESSDD